MTAEITIREASDPQRTTALSRVLRSPRTRGGLLLMGLVAVLALLGPLLAPNAASAIVGSPFEAPSFALPFGTDNLGRDVLSRFLWGGRSLIIMSLCAAVIGVAIGAVLGLLAAYVGSWGDLIMMRGMDVLLAFPTVIFALLFISTFGTSVLLLVSVVAIAQIPGTARVVRGASRAAVDGEFVLWARGVGLSTPRILVGEILPTVVSPLMVELGLRLMWAVGALSALSFLGYGIQPPTADWGLMINENRNGLSVQPMAVIPPMVAIALFTVGGNLFAEGVARVIGRTDRKASA
ncbi:ABC transporter permease [Rhodococcus koreensis]